MKNTVFLGSLIFFSFTCSSAIGGEIVRKCPNGAFVKDIVVLDDNTNFGIRCYKSNSNGNTTTFNDSQYWTVRFVEKSTSRRKYKSAKCGSGKFISEILYNDIKDSLEIRCRRVVSGNRTAISSSDYWTNTFYNTTTNNLNSTQCNNSGVGAEIILKDGFLNLRCRQAVIDGNPLIFSGDYWTRPFPEQVSFSQPNISGLKLPISGSKGSSKWLLDERGGVSGSIRYSVGSGSGSKKYSSGLVVELELIILMDHLFP